MSKMIILFQIPEEPGCFLRFDYDQGFIEALKASIPFNHRKWDPDSKLWWVDDAHFSTALRLAHRFFDDVRDRTGDPEPKAESTSALANPYSVLYLLPTAPTPVVKAVYRCLAKMCHPDAGGDAERMKLINRAYEAIEEGSHGG